ncbi:MAG: NUDIX hydrolase [Gemmatimonadaceae bacterium]
MSAGSDRTGRTGRPGGNGKNGKPRRARRETSAGGVVYRLTDGRPLYLLIRDSYGNWGFPKGHLERGERAGTAALREVLEETGLRGVRVVAPIDTIEWHFRFRGTLIHKRCEFFLMETDARRTTPQRDEGITACRWTPADEAIDLIGYDNARAILRRAHEMVGALKVATGPPA